MWVPPTAARTPLPSMVMVRFMMDAHWSAEQVVSLGENGKLEIPWARRLDQTEASSVRAAVKKLNEASTRAPEEFCVVYNEHSRGHYLLYRRGYREKAMAKLREQFGRTCRNLPRKDSQAESVGFSLEASPESPLEAPGAEHGAHSKQVQQEVTCLRSACRMDSLASASTAAVAHKDGRFGSVTYSSSTSVITSEAEWDNVTLKSCQEQGSSALLPAIGLKLPVKGPAATSRPKRIQEEHSGSSGGAVSKPEPRIQEEHSASSSAAMASACPGSLASDSLLDGKELNTEDESPWHRTRSSEEPDELLAELHKLTGIFV